MAVLRVISTIVAILTGIITIYGFVVDQGLLQTQLTDEVVEFMSSARPTVRAAWPLDAISTAAAICVLVSVGVIAFERALFADEYFVTIMLLAPLPAAWAWIFFNDVGLLGFGSFFAAYLIVSWIAANIFDFAKFAFDEWSEVRRHRVITGVADNVRKTSEKRFGTEHQIVTFVLHRDQDLPVRVCYRPFSVAGQKLPSEGDLLHLIGGWKEGLFEAKECEIIPRHKSRTRASRSEP